MNKSWILLKNSIHYFEKRQFLQEHIGHITCKSIKKVLVSYCCKSANLATSQMGAETWLSFRPFIVDVEHQMDREQSQVAYQKENDHPMKSYRSNSILQSRHSIIKKEGEKDLQHMLKI